MDYLADGTFQFCEENLIKQSREDFSTLVSPFTGCRLGFRLSKLWKNIFSNGTEPDESIGVGSITECRKPDIFFDG
jgi:hypothetical protein